MTGEGPKGGDKRGGGAAGPTAEELAELLGAETEPRASDRESSLWLAALDAERGASDPAARTHAPADRDGTSRGGVNRGRRLRWARRAGGVLAVLVVLVLATPMVLRVGSEGGAEEAMSGGAGGEEVAPVAEAEAPDGPAARAAAADRATGTEGAATAAPLAGEQTLAREPGGPRPAEDPDGAWSRGDGPALADGALAEESAVGRGMQAEAESRERSDIARAAAAPATPASESADEPVSPAPHDPADPVEAAFRRFTGAAAGVEGAVLERALFVRRDAARAGSAWAVVEVRLPETARAEAVIEVLSAAGAARATVRPSADDGGSRIRAVWDPSGVLAGSAGEGNSAKEDG